MLYEHKDHSNHLSDFFHLEVNSNDSIVDVNIKFF